jgi:predicted site-specific integrase-resolvase
MPFEVDGTHYLTASDVLKELKITRQTLWRWRQEGKVPLGRRYRNKKILFSSDELEAIRTYANRVEPIERASEKQLGLFASPNTNQKN